MAEVRPDRSRGPKRRRGGKGPAPTGGGAGSSTLVDIGEALCSCSDVLPVPSLLPQEKLGLDEVAGDCVHSSSDSHQMVEPIVVPNRIEIRLMGWRVYLLLACC